MPSNSYREEKAANEARLLAAEARGDGVVDAWPVEMVFEFTAACNLHCRMCGYERMRDEFRAEGRSRFTLSVEMFRKIAERAFPFVRVVNPTTSGEPFVLPYWDELVDTVARHGCKLEIVTNGMLLHGDLVPRLMPHLANLVVSFDGATKATFEGIRTGADYDRILANVAEFARVRRELGFERLVRFGFNVTLMRENVHELPRIVEIAAAHGVDGVTATAMVVVHESLRSSSPATCPERTNAALAEARAVARRLGVDLHVPAPFPPLPADRVSPSRDVGRPRPREEAPPSAAPIAEAPVLVPRPEAPPRDAAVQESAPAATEDVSAWISQGRPPGWSGKYYCNMAWRRLYVGLEGEAFPCCAPTRPLMGNVFREDFFAVWNGEAYRRLREGLHSGNLVEACRSCPYLQQSGATPYEGEVTVYAPPRER